MGNASRRHPVRVLLPKVSETLSPLRPRSSNPPRAVPIVKAKLAAHRLFLRERINTSGQQASPFLQIHTPSLVLLPHPLPHPRFPRFVCPFVARAAYLSMTPKTTEELKAPSLLYYVVLLIWPSALCFVILLLVPPQRRCCSERVRRQQHSHTQFS